jgi:hypothetical protein
MRTRSILLAATCCLALPVALAAANICVWNYDLQDRFYDAEVGDSIDCAYHVAATLTGLGHTVTVFDEVLPEDLAPYDAVFCLMGWYRC